MGNHLISDREIVAQDVWGEDVPDWIMPLVRECNGSSQNKVATHLGGNRRASQCTKALQAAGQRQDVGARRKHQRPNRASPADRHAAGSGLEP